MVGLYGQIVPAVGYRGDYFESWGDDDPADREVVLPPVFFEEEELDEGLPPFWGTKFPHE